MFTSLKRGIGTLEFQRKYIKISRYAWNCFHNTGDSYIFTAKIESLWSQIISRCVFKIICTWVIRTGFVNLYMIVEAVTCWIRCLYFGTSERKSYLTVLSVTLLERGMLPGCIYAAGEGTKISYFALFRYSFFIAGRRGLRQVCCQNGGQHRNNCTSFSIDDCIFSIAHRTHANFVRRFIMSIVN